MLSVIESIEKFGIKVSQEFILPCYKALQKMYQSKVKFINQNHACTQFYLSKLNLNTNFQKNNHPSTCISHKTSRGNIVQIDISKKTYTWDSRKSSQQSRYISKDDIKVSAFYYMIAIDYFLYYMSNMFKES